MLDYIVLKYRIRFETKVKWNKSPSIIFRSVLGAQLKKLTCVLKQNECESCILNSSCVYACFFESPIEKDKKVLLGRNRSPHPFTLDVKLIDEDKADIKILFIGKSRNYIPYITLALQKAGELGISKSRTHYDLVDVLCNNLSYSFDVNTFPEVSKKWPVEDINLKFNSVKFLTPCRIKKQGHYLNKITANDFFKAIERRIFILDQIYGDGTFKIKNEPFSLKSHSIDQKWVDFNYYSSRQKEALKIGGVIGELLIIDGLDEYTFQLLKAAEIFNVGKNISMGLGKIALSEEEI